MSSIMLVTIPKIAFSLKNQMHLRKARFITALSLRTGGSCKTPSTPACLLSAWEAGWCGRYCQSGSTVPPGLPSARLKGLWPWRVFFRNRTRGDYMGRMHGKHAPGGLPCNSSHLRDHRGVQQNQGPARTSYSVTNRKAQDCTSAALHPPASAARNTDSQSGYDDLSKSGNSCAITFASNALWCCPSERSARK